MNFNLQRELRSLTHILLVIRPKMRYSDLAKDSQIGYKGRWILFIGTGK